MYHDYYGDEASPGLVLCGLEGGDGEEHLGEGEDCERADFEDAHELQPNLMWFSRMGIFYF